MTAEPISLASDLHAGPVKIGVLGPMELAAGVPPSAPKIRRVLAVLARKAGRPIPISEIARELWAETPISSALTCVHTYMMRLRRTPGITVETLQLAYRLVASPLDIDAHRFTHYTNQARRQLHEDRVLEAQDTLRAAFSLWCGEPLSDVTPGSVLANWVAELRDTYQTALGLRLDVDLRLGRHREVVDELRAIVRGDPSKEDMAGRLMVALYRCQRQVEALRIYTQVRGFLGAEYGLSPGPELERLQQQVLRGDKALEWQGGAT